jgi:Raf kinase inhibitor-like YbhB/YbcL family protein
MRALRCSLILVATLAVAMPLVAQGGGGGRPGLTLSTTAFPDGGTIPLRFTQAGEGVAPGEGTSPALTWTNVPEGVVSYVLYMHDMEPARDRTIEDNLHWLVWPIPASQTSLAEGQPRGARLPNGAFQVSATGQVYRGPGAGAAGPPHHYVFELLALDTTIDVQPTDDVYETRRHVLSAVQGHILARAVYMGLFKRPS